MLLFAGLPCRRSRVRAPDGTNTQGLQINEENVLPLLLYLQMAQASSDKAPLWRPSLPLCHNIFIVEVFGLLEQQVQVTGVARKPFLSMARPSLSFK